MSSFILLLIIPAIIAIISFRKKPTRARSTATPKTVTGTDQKIPDLPVGFGYKCMWMAVKTVNTQKLVELLKVRNLEPCNWKVGIDQAYKGYVFITPPIDGWTLACGTGLPNGDRPEDIEHIKSLLETLSKTFGDAQFFCTHRVVEYHCWIKAVAGKVVRVYAYLGESGENITIEGEPTAIEKPLNLANTFSPEAKDENYFGREDIVWPDEQLVMEIARDWSVDPSQLGERTGTKPELGLLGDIYKP